MQATSTTSERGRIKVSPLAAGTYVPHGESSFGLTVGKNPSPVGENGRGTGSRLSKPGRSAGESLFLDCESCGRDWPEGWFESVETIRGQRLEVCARCAWSFNGGAR